ncbi:MAG: hypothetical protein STSR0007_11210 [Thermovirga sp.]
MMQDFPLGRSFENFLAIRSSACKTCRDSAFPEDCESHARWVESSLVVPTRAL